MYAVRIADNRFFSSVTAGSKCHARLCELEGRLEVVESSGRTVVGERHGASGTQPTRAERTIRFLDIVCPSSFIDYKCGMPILKGV